MSSYEEIGRKIGKLVARKNEEYGESFAKCGEILKILYPDGIKIGDYKTLLSITRILDKLFRICTNKDKTGEDPFQDIAGYCILMIAERENEKEDYGYSMGS